MKPWYVLAIKSSQWRKALDKISALDVETFYPMRTVWRKQRTGPRKRIERPLIPSYIFVGVDLSSVSARSILSIDGVISFLGVRGVPQECDLDQLAHIRQLWASGDYDETSARIAQLIIGQTIPITVGPFADFHGTITAINGNELTLDVRLLGRNNVVKIDIDKTATLI